MPASVKCMLMRSWSGLLLHNRDSRCVDNMSDTC